MDSSKSALDWATANFEKNEVNNVRLIREDALSFMRKEARRGKQYDFIVLDPPGFSRFRDGTWNVTDILPELCTLLTTLLSSKQGQAYFTFHGADLNGDTVRNILMDVGGTDPKHISWRQLSLIEKSGRVIPAGVLISAKACS